LALFFTSTLLFEPKTQEIGFVWHTRTTGEACGTHGFHTFATGQGATIFDLQLAIDHCAISGLGPVSAHWFYRYQTISRLSSEKPAF